MNITREIKSWFHALFIALSFITNTCESKEFIRKGGRGNP